MTANKVHIADVIIAGGGVAGMTMALLLKQSGLNVVCLDRADRTQTLDPAYDIRTTAISAGSKAVFMQAGVWDVLEEEACPIQDIRIGESGSACLLNFLAQDVEADAFGWIIDNTVMRQAFYQKLDEMNITHITGAEVTDMHLHEDLNEVVLLNGDIFQAPLVIGADGRQSFIREACGIDARSWPYQQSAIVTTFTHTQPHHNAALEDFRPEGPLAVLPMFDDAKGCHRSALVWTEEQTARPSRQDLCEDIFLEALNARLPDWYGEATSITRRMSYPLGLIHAHAYTAPRTALIADAAHGIHPIAGQGLNLGLRDVACLSDLIGAARQQGQDIGSDTLLEKYERLRRPDNMLMAGATDMLNRLFSNRSSALSPLRKLGLRMVEKNGPAKRFFMRQAMGTPGFVPKMIRKNLS